MAVAVAAVVVVVVVAAAAAAVVAAAAAAAALATRLQVGPPSVHPAGTCRSAAVSLGEPK